MAKQTALTTVAPDAVQRFSNWAADYKLTVGFIHWLLEEGVDYGIIQGVKQRSLWQAGAEKLCTFYHLHPDCQVIRWIEDPTGKDHNDEAYFQYTSRTVLTDDEGRFVAAMEATCCSWEKKYRYRWVPKEEVPAYLYAEKLPTQGGLHSEFSFAIDKGETTGQYGKPAEYWQNWRDAIANGTAKPIKRKARGGKEYDAYEMDMTLYGIPNTDVYDQMNTVQMMSQKRSFVACTRKATGTSALLTQDMGEVEKDLDDVVEGEFTVVDAKEEEAGKWRLIRELTIVQGSQGKPPYKDKEEVGSVIAQLGITYELARHDEIKKRLIDFKLGPE